MKRKISIAIGAFQREYGDMKALEIAKEAGVDAVDFDTSSEEWDYRNPDSIFSKSDDEIVEYFTALKRRAEELGIEIGQTHGRITGFKNIKEEDEALIKNARLDCLAASVLGAPVCVMHSVTTIFMGPDAAPELMHKLNFDMFSRIMEFAKLYNIKIATETFGDAVCYNCCDFFGNINEFLMAYNNICEIDDYADYFTICVDTGHSNKASRFNNNPTPGDVIRMLGKNVTVLHLNDNDKMTDQHKIPLSGTIDWDDVFDALDEIGYNGIYNMELVLGCFGDEIKKDTAAFAVKVMRNILDKRYGK